MSNNTGWRRLAWVMGALLLSVAVTSVAFAQEAGPAAAGTRWGGGTVIAVGADSLTVRGRRGQEWTVYVDANTQFTDRDAQPTTLAEIEAGNRVVGAVTLREDGKRYAVIVHVFPARSHFRSLGTASALAADHFTLTNRRGRQQEVYVDAGTQISSPRRPALTYGDVTEGARVFVKAELREDGKWWATEIKVKSAQADGAP